MKPLLFLLLCLPLYLWGQSGILTQTILFAHDQSSIEPEMKKILVELLDSLPNYAVYKIDMKGHTDNVGGNDYNLRLSEKRCLAVYDFLKTQGHLPDSIFDNHFWGETQAVADNTSPEGRKRNRRVEVEVRYRRNPPAVTALPKVVTQSASPIEPPITGNIFDLYKQTQAPLQIFNINPQRDTVLRCTKGTVIYLRANAFDLSEGCSDKFVTFRAKEILTKSEMILENLSTSSDGKPLASDGMIYTDAWDCKGKKLTLLPEKDMVVFLPTLNPTAEMQIFGGERNPHDSIMNWEIDPNAVISSFSAQVLDDCGEWMRNTSPIPDCKKCPLFFCRIRLTIGSALSREKREKNMALRLCAKETREFKKRQKIFEAQNRARLANGKRPIPAIALQRPPIQEALRFKCEELESLLKKYNVTNVVELRQKLREETQQQLETKYKNKNLSFEEYQYYIFNRGQLGWANCDIFVRLPQPQITMQLNLKPEKNNDSKLVFVVRKTVFAPVQSGTLHEYPNVPKGEEVYLVALKYEENRCYLSLKRTLIKEERQVPDFKEYTVEGLKKALEVLDNL